MHITASAGRCANERTRNRPPRGTYLQKERTLDFSVHVIPAEAAQVGPHSYWNEEAELQHDPRLARDDLSAEVLLQRPPHLHQAMHGAGVGGGGIDGLDNTGRVGGMGGVCGVR